MGVGSPKATGKKATAGAAAAKPRRRGRRSRRKGRRTLDVVIHIVIHDHEAKNRFEETRAGENPTINVPSCTQPNPSLLLELVPFRGEALSAAAVILRVRILELQQEIEPLANVVDRGALQHGDRGAIHE